MKLQVKIKINNYSIMSCLFDSLSYFIQEDSFKIRQMICDYLEENKPIMDGIETHEILGLENNDDANSYIESMRLASTLGGAIEIQAACNIWNLQINVSNYRDQNSNIIEILPVKGNCEKTIHIYWNGGHYEPIK
jgi:hypothetical protein